MATQAEIAEITADRQRKAAAEKKAAEDPGSLTDDDLTSLPAATIAECMRTGSLQHLGYGRSRGSYR